MIGERTGAPLGLSGSGGWNASVAPMRGAVVAVAAAALLLLSACVHQGTATRPTVTAQAVQSDIDAGLDLYASGEFSMSAQRFRLAADGAVSLGDHATQRNAVVAECMAWLRERRLQELSQCTLRLERLQRRQRRTDPGVNTLMAVGAIAGNRAIPPFKLPSAVHPIVRAAAKETP